jgi:uncharacterized RmlC-like cupin family protein
MVQRSTESTAFYLKTLNYTTSTNPYSSIVVQSAVKNQSSVILVFSVNTRVKHMASTTAIFALKI